MTCMSSRYGLNGERQGVNWKSGPVSRGIQYFSGMPLPLNHNTNRDSIARDPALPAAAYAVPFPLNMAASGGSPMRTIEPASPPRRNIRRERAIAFLKFIYTAIAIIDPYDSSVFPALNRVSSIRSL